MPEISKLLQTVESGNFTAEQVAAITRQIHTEILAKSSCLEVPNFRYLCSEDLKMLFDLYDQKFFQGQLREAVGEVPLRFSISKRMTSSGGKTVTHLNRTDGSPVLYEIGVSLPLLSACFTEENQRLIVCSGIPCRDRLDAMQRVMEHEITHLTERLLWNESNCTRPRFASITRRFFGHTENKHKLITPRERAFTKFGIRTGSRVQFRFEGAHYTGIVNRITKRATVLVEDPHGTPYRNGKRYKKFYVPVQMLEAVQ